MNRQYSTRWSRATQSSVAVSENCKRAQKGLRRKIAQVTVAVLLAGLFDVSLTTATAQTCTAFSSGAVQNLLSGSTSISTGGVFSGCSLVNANSTLTMYDGRIDELEVGSARDNLFNAHLIVNGGNIGSAYIDSGSRATINGGSFRIFDNAGSTTIHQGSISQLFNDGQATINAGNIGFIHQGSRLGANFLRVNDGTIREVFNESGEVEVFGGQITRFDNADTLYVVGGAIENLYSDGYVEINGGAIQTSINDGIQDIWQGRIGSLEVRSNGDTALFGNIRVTEAIDLKSGSSFTAGSSPVVITLGTGGSQERVLFKNADNLTLTNISFAGNAGLQKEGNATLTLVRASTHSGDNLIQEGRLAAMVSGALGSGTYEVATGASLDIYASQSIRGLKGNGNINITSTPTLTLGAGSVMGQTYVSHSDIYAPTTDLLKEGGAHQTLAGDVHFNQIQINRGQLEFAGDVVAQQISVNNGNLVLTGANQTWVQPIAFNGGGLILGVNNVLTANIPSIRGAENVLGGNGTLTLSNPEGVRIEDGARVSPGQSIGQLTVNGKVTIANTGVFEVEVDPNNTASADHLQVNGNLVLGGDLRHIAQSNINSDINFASGQQWVITDVAGTMSGQFDAVTSNLVLLKPTVDYSNPQQLSLSFSIIDDPFSRFAVSKNQLAVAGAIESMELGVDPITNALLNQITSEDGMRQALDGLSGEIHASIVNQAHQIVRNQGGTNLQRLSLNQWKSGQGVVQKAGAGDGVWVSFQNSSVQITDNEVAATTKTDGYHLQIGYDAQRQDGLLLGGSLAYGHYEMEAEQRFSEAEFNQFALSAYVGYDFGGEKQNGLRWTSQASVNYLADIDTTRRIPFGNYQPIQGSYDATVFRLDNELALPIAITPTWSVEPHVVLGFSALSRDAFTEQDHLFALSAESRSENSSDLTVGLRTRYLQEDQVAVYGSVGWQHLLQDAEEGSTVRFASGNPMMIRGAETDTDIAVLAVGANLRLGKQTGLYLQYEGGFGTQYESHTTTFGLKHRF